MLVPVVPSLIEEVAPTYISPEVAACEQILSQGSFLHFLKYVKIVEAPTMGNKGGVIEFQLWPHLKEMVAVLLTSRFISVFKARQIGASYLLAAWSIWWVLSKKGGNILLFSKGEAEAIELLGKCRTVYANLPDFLRFKLGNSSQTELSFPGMMSSIKAFAATETAGISYTASIVICDEHDEHPFAKQNYINAKPTIDAGGQFISCFTPSNPDPDTLAKSLYLDACEGKNDFRPLYFPWNIRPGRTQEWYETIKRNIPMRELGALTPEIYMQRNYHSSVAEALKPLRTTAAFDQDVLDEMQKEVREPLVVRDSNLLKVHQELDKGVVSIYQDYHIGGKYIASADVGHGMGRDYSVLIIMDVRTGVVVADIFHRVISPSEFAIQSVQLLHVYKDPIWYIENNDWGRAVIDNAVNLGYEKWGYQDENKTKIGFHTSEVTRQDLWAALIPAIANRQITIYNMEGLKQFYDVIRNPDKNGRIEAKVGRHDDYPVAVGIAWLKREKELNEWKPKPVYSLHFTGGEPGRTRR